MEQATLLRVLHYDPETGLFRWREKPARRIAIGAVAGCVQSFGGWFYITIRFETRGYLAHRLAWFYMTGAWPHPEVDHRDGDGLNNRWNNLRQGTRAQQAQNMKRHRDNKSGFVGVNPFRKGWRAEICVDGVNRHLGVFDTAETAHQAYLAAKRERHVYQPVPREGVNV